MRIAGPARIELGITAAYSLARSGPSSQGRVAQQAPTVATTRPPFRLRYSRFLFERFCL